MSAASKPVGGADVLRADLAERSQTIGGIVNRLDAFAVELGVWRVSAFDVLFAIFAMPPNKRQEVLKPNFYWEPHTACKGKFRKPLKRLHGQVVMNRCRCRHISNVEIVI